MKACQTCGRILNDSTEVYTVNGIVQCRKCAYPNSPASMCEDNDNISTPIKQDIKINNSWNNILKTIGRINIVLGCIISIVIGIVVYDMIYDAGLLAICVTFAGIILSILSSSLLMAFTEMADNIAAIRYNSDKKQ